MFRMSEGEAMLKAGSTRIHVREGEKVNLCWAVRGEIGQLALDPGGEDVSGVETGTVQFNGGLAKAGGPGGAGRASQGFTHGTYKPKNGG